MKIGEVAAQTGVSESTIRYYERNGVLPCPGRDCLGYRDYTDSDLARIQLVTGARRLGCSFDEIKAIIAMQDKRHVPPTEILELLADKAGEVSREMERLEHVQRELARLHNLGLTLVGGKAISTD